MRTGHTARRYRQLSWMARLICRAAFIRLTVQDRERIPKDRVVIITCNHPSKLATVLLWASIGFNQVSVIADVVWRRNRAARWLFRTFGYVIIEREDTMAAAVGARQALESLKNGDSITIYPEAKRVRRHAIGPFKEGAAHLSLMSGCPIVPIGVQIKRFGRWPKPWRRVITFRVGVPLHPHHYPDRKAMTAALLASTVELSEYPYCPEQ